MLTRHVRDWFDFWLTASNETPASRQHWNWGQGVNILSIYRLSIYTLEGNSLHQRDHDRTQNVERGRKKSWQHQGAHKQPAGSDSGVKIPTLLLLKAYLKQHYASCATDFLELQTFGKKKTALIKVNESMWSKRTVNISVYLYGWIRKLLLTVSS